MKTYIFYIHKIKEVIVIYEDKNFIFITFLIIVLSFECFKNNKIFAIMAFILCFY